jgi:ATP-dependent Clp protease ATP-binding subunit ClpA
VHSQVMTVTRGHFSPEFLIALAIIVFDSFGVAQLEKIVQKAMKSVKKKQLEEQGIQIVLQKSGVNVILEASCGKAYGTCSA